MQDKGFKETLRVIDQGSLTPAAEKVLGWIPDVVAAQMDEGLRDQQQTCQVCGANTYQGFIQ